jgi:phenylpyruvate tautomerase PptA (4-oxalocrotonate tautomerase family)
MPVLKISIVRGRDAAHKKALLDAVHESLVSAFKVPEHDRVQRIVEFEPDDFEIPDEKRFNYTLIEITIFPGRSPAAKKQLFGEIVSRLEPLGVPPANVLIILHEPPLDNWGVRGGRPASEVDLGFDLVV